VRFLDATRGFTVEGQQARPTHHHAGRGDTAPISSVLCLSHSPAAACSCACGWASTRPPRPGRRGGASRLATATRPPTAPVRAILGRLSAISVLLCESVLYGAFVWARRALNSRKRWFPARAVTPWNETALFEGSNYTVPRLLPSANQVKFSNCWLSGLENLTRSSHPRATRLPPASSGAPAWPARSSRRPTRGFVASNWRTGVSARVAALGRTTRGGLSLRGGWPRGRPTSWRSTSTTSLATSGAAGSSPALPSRRSPPRCGRA
jgi:hypothetical protein